MAKWPLLAEGSGHWSFTAAYCALRPPAFEERLQLAAAGRVAQLAERLRFDLADAFTRDGEVLADLFEGVFVAFADAETHLDDPLFARRQRLETALPSARAG
jgi:hypothetical protein